MNLHLFNYIPPALLKMWSASNIFVQIRGALLKQISLLK